MNTPRILSAAAGIAAVLALSGCGSMPMWVSGDKTPDQTGAPAPDNSQNAPQPAAASGSQAAPATAAAAPAAAPAPNPADAAIADLDKVVAQKTDDLAQSFADRAAAKQSKPDLDGALADLGSLVGLEPTDVIAFMDRGEIELTESKIDPAIADFSRAIDVQASTPQDHAVATETLHHLLSALFPGMVPNDQADAYYLRGAARQARGDTDGAMADLNKAIELSNDFAAAYNNRGVIRGMALSDAKGAIDDFNHAIDVQPKSADAYANRGNIKTAMNDIPGAMADFNTAVELDSNWPMAYFGRAFAKQRTGDIDGAIADLNKAIELKPDYEDAFFNRAIDYERKEDLDDAIADYDRVIALKPDMADAYANRGIDKYRKNDIESAINDFSHAISLKRDMVKAYVDRAVASRIKGDLPGAIADYASVISLADKDTGIYPQLYRAVFMLEDHRGDPKKDLAAAITSWPDGWPKTIASYLTGDLSESAFLAKAELGDPKTAADQRCEAFYFVGITHLLDGDAVAAKNFFRQSQETNRTDRYALKFAQTELAQLTAVH